MERIVLVTTTVDARAVADALAGSAVGARLAACGQVGGPIRSTYRWQGAVESAEEWTVQFKTAADRVDALLAHLRAAHPYEVPEILVTAVLDGHPDYLTWVVEQTRD